MAAHPYAPFTSARLIYRAIEDNADDDNFIDSIQKNPRSVANSSTFLHRPQSKEMSMQGYKRDLLRNKLLAVFICLRPVDAAAGGGSPDDEGAARDEEARPTPIGIIALDDSGSNHRHHRESDLGIDIAGAYQGQGYGSEAIAWALHWAFQTAGLHRVALGAFSYNTRAVKLYQHLGFLVEGRRREAIWYEGGWHDGILMSMLEHEWRERQKTGAVGAGQGASALISQ